MDRYAFAGGTAIVTGAASGIGEALAHGLAARGSHLVLLDRDQARLTDVARRVRGRHHDLTVDTVVVDLADDAATRQAGRRLAAEYPQTTLLINNAGVALGGRFEQATLEEFNWLIDINFRAVVTLTHHLLPVLRAHPGAHLAGIDRRRPRVLIGASARIPDILARLAPASHDRLLSAVLRSRPR